MRKLVTAMGLMAFVVAAQGQQVLQCANPDVLNSLVFNARPEARLIVRRTMPDIVAGFRAPVAFTLIGSGVRGQVTTAVAYKTALEARPALEQLSSFLADEGWKPEDQALPTVNVAGLPLVTAQLCRNGERRNIQMREQNGTRYAIISGAPTAATRECGTPSLQMGIVNPMVAINAARASLPQFTFPDSARTASRLPGGDPGGSNVVSSIARIESPDTPASLARLLGRQLSQQGWRGDAAWDGAVGAGSTWSRRNAEGQALVGTLEIVQAGEGAYDVGFTMTRPPQPGAP